MELLLLKSLSDFLSSSWWLQTSSTMTRLEVVYLSFSINVSNFSRSASNDDCLAYNLLLINLGQQKINGNSPSFILKTTQNKINATSIPAIIERTISWIYSNIF